MAKADFWQKNQEEISKLNQQRSLISEKVDQWHKYYQETEDAKILAEMAYVKRENTATRALQTALALAEHVTQLIL